jgi:hypothetical protein
MDAGGGESALRAAVGCTLSAWRRLLTGRYQLSLEIFVVLADVLDRACGELCR